MSGKVFCGATLRGSETGRLDPGHKCHYRAVAGTEPPRCRLHGGISERHLRAIATTLPAATVRILHDYDIGWCRVELNGEKFCEGHTFDEGDFVKLLQQFGARVTRKEVEFDEDAETYVEGEDLD